MSFLTSSRPVVVIVDNDPLMLTGIAAVLHQAGYQCHQARDCEAALKAARNLAPDLMILNAELGEENGLELGRYMSDDPKLREISLLYLSASHAADIVEQTQAAGGDYFLAKPFDPNVLIEVVDRALWMPHLVHNNLRVNDLPSPAVRPTVVIDRQHTASPSHLATVQRKGSPAEAG